MNFRTILWIILVVIIAWGAYSFIGVKEPLDQEQAALEDGHDHNDGTHSHDAEGNNIPLDADTLSLPEGGAAFYFAPVVSVGEVAGPNKGVRVAPLTALEDDIMVSDQPAGNVVELDMVSSNTGGWVVIYEDSATNPGTPGNVWSAQRFDSGAYEGGRVELIRSTESGGIYHAMWHYDDGDKAFNYKIDLPLLDENEQVISVSFLIE